MLADTQQSASTYPPKTAGSASSASRQAGPESSRDPTKARTRVGADRQRQGHRLAPRPLLARETGLTVCQSPLHGTPYAEANHVKGIGRPSAIGAIRARKPARLAAQRVLLLSQKQDTPTRQARTRKSPKSRPPRALVASRNASSRVPRQARPPHQLLDRDAAHEMLTARSSAHRSTASTPPPGPRSTRTGQARDHSGRLRQHRGVNSQPSEWGRFPTETRRAGPGASRCRS